MLVSITPAKIRLRPTDPNNRKASQHLRFSILNRTASPVRVNRFYGGWSPILVSEDGLKLVRLEASRDATFLPKSKDFPLLAPGASAVDSRSVWIASFENELGLALNDSTGSIFSCAVVPGNYKLCIWYSGKGELGLIESGTKYNGVNASNVWTGWQMSNWIDLEIVAE